MTLHMPQSNQHITDLLPAYINSRLDEASAARIRAHLAECETCRHELATWEAVSGATQFATTAMPLPSAKLMSQVWEKIDAQEMTAAPHRSIQRLVLHLWLVFSRQMALIHKSIWIAAIFINTLMCALVFLSGSSAHNHLHGVENILAFFTTIAAASSVAFIYQAEHDAGYELMLSTPTSIRVVMICRMVLVVGYNLALAAISSAIIAIALGGTLWDFMQIWLGPMLLLASISLTVSVTLGSVVSVVVALVLEILQAITSSVDKLTPELQFLHTNIWQTTPMTLLIALFLVVFAVFYASHQPRLSNF
ncbi:MAG TPA: zf-HC2 domain-containing protein [Ktedonobacteraceae bacterium]|nr:zf-HC2 domain-containing protein [Ktedonobacteraceae bacterium]